MNPTPFGYVGIDFGTSNSHFAYSNCAGHQISATPLRLGGQASATTCVLFQRATSKVAETVIAYGGEAIDTWMQWDADKRAAHYFALAFKPDLVRSERARRDAQAFFHAALEDIQRDGKLPRPIGPTGMAVVIGVPAEIGAEHRRLTADAARAAGFGDVECVEEPLGALAFHLCAGDLTPAEARAGVVVVDFGGGTLDIAPVSDQGLGDPWGEPALGGRLFDDLFYQWVHDQNPTLQVDEREAMVVWQKECRDLKEKFSKRWHSLGDAMSFDGHIYVGDRRVFFKDATVAEFERRAHAYRPSDVVRRYFGGLDSQPAELFVDGPIDLYDWILRVITRDRSIGISKGTFSKVILTGGSSDWPFMTGLVAQAFGIDAAKDILRSSNPEMTIGSGLAIYNVLKLRNDRRRSAVREKKPQAVKQFETAVGERLDRFANDAASAVVKALMPRVEEAFWEWYKKGGTLQKVEQNIEVICEKFVKEKEADAALKRHFEALETDLVRLMRDHLQQFITDNEIPKDAIRYIPESSTLAGMKVRPGVGKDIAAELGAVAEGVTAATAAIAALVVTGVKIKVIILLAFTHPFVAVLVGIAALATTLGLGGAAKEAVENKVRTHDFGPITLRLMKLTLRESKFREKLNQGRVAVQQDLRREIRQSTRTAAAPAPTSGNKTPAKALEPLLIEKFEAIIDLVIKDLGVLEQFGSAKDESSKNVAAEVHPA